MDSIHSQVDIKGDAFAKNETHHLGLKKELNEKLNLVLKGGGE